MKKLLLTILGPFFFVVAVTVGIIWWDRGAPPGFRPPLVNVTVQEITRENRGVRVQGTAHFELRIKLKEGDTVYHVYPLFPRGDTMGRDIRVLVRTLRAPDRLVGFEDVTVEGFARPPGYLIPGAVIEALLAQGYSIQEDYVLINEFED